MIKGLIVRGYEETVLRGVGRRGVGWKLSTFFFSFLTQSRSSVRQSQWGTKLTRRFCRVALELKPTAIIGLRSPLAEGNCALCCAASSQLDPLRCAVRGLKENAEREKPEKVKPCSHSLQREAAIPRYPILQCVYGQRACCSLAVFARL